ncbi:hypothetical protein HOC35_01410 [Candidatus Woesearchaeota archaeon]|jgi:hypothetical protein|nr:hypothetical protein [Candidatus Woesearchaeota archaeon]
METNKLKQQRRYLKAEAIIKYFNGDNTLETEIMCKPKNNLVTSDQSLYEALGSFEDKSLVDINKLVKFLEVVEVISFVSTFKQPRKILTPQRVDELNKLVNGKLVGPSINQINQKDNQKESTNQNESINQKDNQKENKTDNKKIKDINNSKEEK